MPLKVATSEPVCSPDGRRRRALVADPSVVDPELEPVKAGSTRRRGPFEASISSRLDAQREECHQGAFESNRAIRCRRQTAQHFVLQGDRQHHF